MTKTYFRPLALVFGIDARNLIAGGLAGALGGMPSIGFMAVEEMVRDGKLVSKRIRSFADVASHELISNITTVRPPIAGLVLDQPHIMGIVNVTPDSFSDGGRYDATDAAVAHGLALAEQGAAILDIGGESTRPGSSEVSLDEEGSRILPVIGTLAKGHIVSVDTRKSVLMRKAAEVGAKIINDVSALGFDPLSASTVAASGLPVVLMHAQGEPRTMQLAPKYDDVLLDVYDQLEVLVAKAVAAGIPKVRICIDPGIGFGKSFRHNLDLLQGLTIFHGLGVTLLVGLSRKGIVGAVTGEKMAANRVAGSVGGALQAAVMGAHILRVHDVNETVDALAMFRAGLEPDLSGV